MTEIDRRRLLAAAAATASLAAVAPMAKAGVRAVQSVCAMTFAPDGRLVVADFPGRTRHCRRSANRGAGWRGQLISASMASETRSAAASR